MQFTTVALAGFAALASAQSFTGTRASPTAPAPSGCATTYPGSFQLSVTNVTAAASKKAKRQSEDDSELVVTLANGVLTDNQGRIGYIASNYQFQFDLGGQAGQIYTAGFSVCANDTLALGGSAIFYQCLSGEFYNLYDRNWAPQCTAIYLETISDEDSAPASTSATTVAGAVAPPTSSASAAPTTSVAAATSTPASQAPASTTTSRPASSASSLVSSAASAVSTAAVVTSVSATTSSAARVTSISDNQIQAPTSASASVSSVTRSVAIVTSISDGQVQAPTRTSVTAYTGAAAMPTMAAQVVLAVAGAAVAFL